MTIISILVGWILICVAVRLWREKQNQRSKIILDEIKETMDKPSIIIRPEPVKGGQIDPEILANEFNKLQMNDKVESRVQPEVLINVFSQTHWGHLRDYNTHQHFGHEFVKKEDEKPREEKIINPILEIEDSAEKNIEDNAEEQSE